MRVFCGYTREVHKKWIDTKSGLFGQKNIFESRITLYYLSIRSTYWLMELNVIGYVIFFSFDIFHKTDI